MRSPSSYRLNAAVAPQPPVAQNTSAPAALSAKLPVFFFHGVLSNDKSGLNIAANLTAEGRVVNSLAFCNDQCSTRALRDQVQLAIADIREIVSNDLRLYEKGYIFIGHSQGGMLARAVIEEMDDHQVKTFISLAGVVNGVFYGPQPADTVPSLVFTSGFAQSMVPSSVWDLSKYTWPNDFRGKYQYAFDVFASAHLDLQNKYSFFNLARSPVQKEWAASFAFLPELNNINPCAQQDPNCTTNQERRRTNFLKLQSAHFFASPDDGIVAPWQTSILGQYSLLSSVDELKTKFSSLRILNVKGTIEYQEDTYGLKTLDTRGGLFLHTVAHVPHTCWVADSTTYATAQTCSFKATFDQHIYPLL
uniref:Lysosomal thioesterase PPT2 n=1 Tax=Globisporangium ultimum (strain ATCC 200006 / CBS 805.95 / DAOM BR144) TaxID=431595 RepID=K3WY13_GLOUD